MFLISFLLLRGITLAARGQLVKGGSTSLRTVNGIALECEGSLTHFLFLRSLLHLRLARLPKVKVHDPTWLVPRLLTIG